MNLVDSSGWLEYFADGANAGFFAPPIEDTENLMVSTINLYEVFKKLRKEKDVDAALQAIAAMRQGSVAPVDEGIALEAAGLCIETGLPMTDGLILATARCHGAIVWTQDADFSKIRGVKYIRAKK